jgi:hypothetical protein
LVFEQKTKILSADKNLRFEAGNEVFSSQVCVSACCIYGYEKCDKV